MNVVKYSKGFLGAQTQEMKEFKGMGLVYITVKGWPSNLVGTWS